MKPYLTLVRRSHSSRSAPRAEVRYERAIFQRWSVEDGDPESGWHRVIAYQVPVWDRKPPPLGLKAIDLLAVDAKGLPIIIELKIRRGKGADTPLLAILEAASYACVLQADWPAFKDELEAKTKALGISEQLPEELKEFPLVVAGPPAYWDYWNYEERTTMVAARPAFRALLEALSRHGFPVRFVSVEGPVDQPERLLIRQTRFLEG
jgi:hypothetical protein